MKYEEECLTKYDQLEHGMSVTCEIQGEYIDDAKISIDSDGDAFVCQDFKDGNGNDTKEMFGYEYGWFFAFKGENSDKWGLKNLKRKDTPNQLKYDGRKIDKIVWQDDDLELVEESKEVEETNKDFKVRVNSKEEYDTMAEWGDRNGYRWPTMATMKKFYPQTSYPCYLYFKGREVTHSDIKYGNDNRSELLTRDISEFKENDLYNNGSPVWGITIGDSTSIDSAGTTNFGNEYTVVSSTSDNVTFNINPILSIKEKTMANVKRLYKNLTMNPDKRNLIKVDMWDEDDDIFTLFGALVYLTRNVTKEELKELSDKVAKPMIKDMESDE